MKSKISPISFNLISFDLANAPPINIEGTVSRHSDRLKINYQLFGDLSTIIIPGISDRATRQYNLWEHTCFEFFLRLKDSNKYWEFNLSPRGDWNVFRFLDYRKNIAEELAFETLLFSIAPTEEHLNITIEIDLNTIAIAEQKFDLAITAVIENQDQQLSYWALTHPDQKADFHHPDSFVITL